MGKITNNSKSACLLLGVSCLVIASGLAIPSFSWFAKAKTQTEGDSISGSSTSAYFRGKGTAESPYLIETTKQLYYFNWLQDLGYFNKKVDGGSSIDQIYFSLENDLDMSDYVLPPAGTKEYPFLGNFNGKDHVIKNLNINNDFSSLTKKPSNAKDEDGDGLLDDAEIVGFFGIIGEWANGDAYTFDTKANAVSGLYFDNLQINSSASKTLGGLLAGYVNGAMSNCAVRSGNISFTTGASPIQDSVFGTTNDKLSKYSLIGDYNSENFSWKGKPSDKGDQWGASIDIFALSKRISLMSKAIGKDKNYLFESPTYNLNMRLSLPSANYYDYEGSTANSAMLQSGTCLPLTIDEEKMGDLSQFYVKENQTAEIVANNNAAYVVGGGPKSGSTNAVVRIRNQKANKDSQGPKNSFFKFTSTRGLNESGGMFSEDNFSFLYYDTTTDIQYRLLDEKNKSTSFDNSSLGITNQNVANMHFDNYANVKTNLLNMFSSATSDSFLASNNGPLLPGMLILNRDPLSSYPAKKTGENVTVCGTNYATYEFYEGGINFTLKKDGFLSIAVGTYNNSSDAYFFDLYKIDRSETQGSDNATNTIEGYSKIKAISGTPKQSNIAYAFDTTSEESYDSANKTFSFEQISNGAKFKNSSIYFLEIPVRKGSYFMSNAEKGKTNCPYILYFDIGTSANGDGETEENPDIDFTYYKSGTTLALLSDSDYQKSDVSFAITGTPTSTTAFYFWRRNSSSGVFYFIDPTGCVITPSGSGSSSNPGSKDDYTAGA